MAWPYREDNWRRGGGGQRAYAAVAKAIAAFDPLVHMCVPREQLRKAREALGEHERIVIHSMES
eukprot:5612665-Prorocentrum_lima.AAC.1